MAEVPSEIQTGEASADVRQLGASLSVVDLSSSHDLTNRIVGHLKRSVEQFERSDDCPRIVADYLRNTMTRITEEAKPGGDMEIIEYIFAPEDRNQQKRDRLNSCSISLDDKSTRADEGHIDLPTDVPKTSLHYCADCDVEIPILDGETFRPALLRHYTSDPHKPQPKPEVVLPTFSRKMAAMVKAEPAAPESDTLGESETHIAKLIEALVVADSVDAETTVAVYRAFVAMLATKVSLLDLSTAGKVIAPILVSIKDNVNQSPAEAARANDDDDEVADDANARAEPKRPKYYRPIASKLDEHLAGHKLVSLADERGGRPAYFCIPCEFYTLRFSYETVFAHVLSDAHTRLLSEMLNQDVHIPHGFAKAATPHEINLSNKTFLSNEIWISSDSQSDDDEEVTFYCKLCKLQLINAEAMLNHVFEESHMGKLSGKFYFRMKDDKTVDWGQKSVDWKRFNVCAGKALSSDQPIVLENFVKPLMKTLSQCGCCAAMVKGQRQHVFNHVRQKKHIRNAVPRRLTVAFSNFVRPLEFFSSLGHFYTCTLCESFPQSVMLNFSDIYEHCESDEHVSVVAKLLRLYCGSFGERDASCLIRQSIVRTDAFACVVCGLQFGSLQDVVGHVFTDVDHQNNVAAREYEIYKPHIANYLLRSTPIAVVNNNYHCMICDLGMSSTSALLAHLSLADHVPDKLQPEAVFRYYLLLKNNAKTCRENMIFVRDQNTVECQKCKCCLGLEENIRSHVASAKHKGLIFTM